MILFDACALCACIHGIVCFMWVMWLVLRKCYVLCIHEKKFAFIENSPFGSSAALQLLTRTYLHGGNMRLGLLLIAVCSYYK